MLLGDGAEDDPRWARALGALVDRGRFRQLELRSVGSQTVHEAPVWVRDALDQAGFKASYKGWIRRKPTR